MGDEDKDILYEFHDEVVGLDMDDEDEMHLYDNNDELANECFEKQQ
jgi:hypothetical protein